MHSIIKENIKKEYDLTEVSFDTWVKPLRFFDVQDDVVTILIPSDQSHALNYISSKYGLVHNVTKEIWTTSVRRTLGNITT